MTRIGVFAVALATALPAAALAQGMGPGMGMGQGRGPGMGPGRGMGPCAQAQDQNACYRAQNPEKHAACWKEANGKALWGPARREFMMDCMTK